MFDIDHTLIFAIDKNLNPNLMAELSGKTDIHNMRIPTGPGRTHEMWLVVRNGVKEMLEFIAPFCNIYAYSHGLKNYIHAILKIIDPEERYFKDRQNTVLAPKDQ